MPVILAMAAALLGCGVPQRQLLPSPSSLEGWTVYEISDEPVKNPERGLVQFLDFTDEGDVAFVAGLDNVTLANVRIRLDDYLDRPIDPAFIAGLEKGFDRIRRAGLKTVLRFQYNNGSGKDPQLSMVITHIGQLAPIIKRHADVIAVLQAGFIGAWGEWHNSISHLTDEPAREAILARLLEVLPASRSIQLRSPSFKAATFPRTTASAAHDGTPGSRIGHHNDCFLSSETDHGTYPEPSDRWRRYLAKDGRFVPVGGETCAPNPPRTDCKNALRELRRFHWSYLNRSYHPAVIAGWKNQGCFRTIARDLGYRLALRRARWPAQVEPGETITVDLEVENLGFAAPFNPRPVFIAIGGEDARRTAALEGVDPRRWPPDKVYRVSSRIKLPADLEPGDHPLALWLPDPAPMLQPWPAYAIRLSNEKMWQPETGDNRLGTLTVVEAD